MYIFNFHHVEPVVRHADRKQITITPQGLRNFIRTLRFFGMRPVCLRTILSQPGNQAIVSRRDVLLTFDDGYANFYEHAVPVLQEEQCPATVFVLAGRFSGNNEWDQGHMDAQTRDQLMSIEQIKALAYTPLISVGSHGMDHRHYPYLTREELMREVMESYQVLSACIPDSFIPALAYPWGEHHDEANDILQQSPYRLAFTTEKGIWDNAAHPFQVPRYSAYFRDGNPLVMSAKLARYRLFNRFLRKYAGGTYQITFAAGFPAQFDTKTADYQLHSDGTTVPVQY